VISATLALILPNIYLLAKLLLPTVPLVPITARFAVLMESVPHVMTIILSLVINAPLVLIPPSICLLVKLPLLTVPLAELDVPNVV